MTDAKLDYTKAYKELYRPSTKPMLIDVPAMNFIMVAGSGNPNAENGQYADALELLYGLSYTIKMSKKSGEQPDGYFEYAVAPLEGLWWTDGELFDEASFAHKDRFHWISMIRQPEFVTAEVFAWAAEKLAAKKPHLDSSLARLETYEEGLCAQAMHLGPYDDEPASIAKLDAFIADEGYVTDIVESNDPFPLVRRHHEIYLGDPRKTKPENLKTVLRHPVRLA